jgi:predicted transcriptional regulator
MASEDHRVVVLLSVHPEYAESILDGSKRVEFRKTRFGNSPDLAVLYATSPVKKIVGYFEVDSVETMSVGSLWRKYGKVSGMSFNRFMSYYNGSRAGVALEVGMVRWLQRPMSLSALLGLATPPQSFRYLKGAAAGKVLRAAV